MTDNQWAVDCVKELKEKFTELSYKAMGNDILSTDEAYLLGLVLGIISKHEHDK